MKFLSVIIILIGCSVGSFSQTKVSLFNGHNFDGWNVFEPKGGLQEKVKDLFTIEDEMIRLHGKKNGYLITENSFEDFELCLEFRWNTDSTFTRKSENKNSGVMYLIPDSVEHKLWPKGLQFQIKEGSTGDIIMLGGFVLDASNSKPAGSNMVVPRIINASCPIGEWNTVRIMSRNGEIIQMLNGKVVNKGNSPAITKGRILLQYEGYPIDFRNVTIAEY